MAWWFWRRRFLRYVNVFSVFCNYLRLEKDGVLHLKKLYLLDPRMLCAKFGWNWPSVSCGEDAKFTTTTTPTDNGHILIRKVVFSLWLRWANYYFITKFTTVWLLKRRFSTRYMCMCILKSINWFLTENLLAIMLIKCVSMYVD